MSRPSPSGVVCVLCLLLAGPLAAVNGQDAASPVADESALATPWYADAEFAVLFQAASHMNWTLYSPGPNSAVFVSPRAFVGYHFDGIGSVRFTYRNLTEVGHRADYEYDVGSTKNNFSTNWFDLDFVSRDYEPTDGWLLRWEAGGRMVYRSFSSESGSYFSVSTSSANYFGGGPHLGLSSSWMLADSGWSLWARADTAITFGCEETRYESRPKNWDSSWSMPPPPYSQSSTISASQFDLNLQFALRRGWQVGAYVVGMALGAQAEVLSFGYTGSGNYNSFGLVNVGPFLRGEIGF